MWEDLWKDVRYGFYNSTWGGIFEQDSFILRSRVKTTFGWSSKNSLSWFACLSKLNYLLSETFLVSWLILYLYGPSFQTRDRLRDDFNSFAQRRERLLHFSELIDPPELKNNFGDVKWHRRFVSEKSKNGENQLNKVEKKKWNTQEVA